MQAKPKCMDPTIFLSRMETPRAIRLFCKTYEAQGVRAREGGCGEEPGDRAGARIRGLKKPIAPEAVPSATFSRVSQKNEKAIFGGRGVAYRVFFKGWLGDYISGCSYKFRVRWPDQPLRTGEDPSKRSHRTRSCACDGPLVSTFPSFPLRAP